MPTRCGRRGSSASRLIALSLVPLTGFGGQVSLCQMSFAAIGALVMAHHGQGGDPMALLLAAVVCAAVGALVALPALRLSGLYLALATAAFAVFLDRWVFLFQPFDLGPWTIEVLGGRGGRRRSRSTSPASTPPAGTRSSSCWPASPPLAYLLVVTVRRSSFGQRLLAMKDSPAACATLGIDITRLKLSVFALSAAMAGVGGALYAGTLGSVSAERFSFFESLPLLLLTVVGGIGTAAGPLFAGLLIGGFPIAHRHLALARQPQPRAPRHHGHRSRPQPQRRRARHRRPLRGARRGAVRPGRAGRVAGRGGRAGRSPEPSPAGVSSSGRWPPSWCGHRWPRRSCGAARPARATRSSGPGSTGRSPADEVRELDAALGLAADPEEAALRAR